MKKKLVRKPVKNKKATKKTIPSKAKSAKTEKLFNDAILQNLGNKGDGIFVLVSEDSPADEVEYIQKMSQMFQSEHAKFTGIIQFIANRAKYEVEVKTFFRFRKI